MLSFAQALLTAGSPAAESPTKEVLEILGLLANFAGGIVLLVDSLRVRKVIRVKAGAEDFLEDLKSQGVKERDLPVDEHGNPLHTAEELELWLAQGTFRRSWFGFALMMAGFGFELASHFTSLF